MSIDDNKLILLMSNVNNNERLVFVPRRFLTLCHSLINALTVHVGTRSKMSGYPTYQALTWVCSDEF